MHGVSHIEDLVNKYSLNLSGCPELEKILTSGRKDMYVTMDKDKLFRALGVKEFDLGGISEQNEHCSVSKFKLGFGGETVTFYNCQKVYSKLYGLAQFLLR